MMLSECGTSIVRAASISAAVWSLADRNPICMPCPPVLHFVPIKFDCCKWLEVVHYFRGTWPPTFGIVKDRELLADQHFCMLNCSAMNNSPNQADLRHLRRCIALAIQAREAGQHPFAALVVDENGETLVEAQNLSRPPEGDPTQHAELVAASRAAKLAPPERLAKATLYTSAEPCCMCAGAIYWTNIGRVVYALSEARLLSLTGANEENPTFSLPCREVFARGQRRVEIAGPFLEDEAAKPHEDFWG